MSIQYGSMYVDEQYKATVLPNLFYKTWLVPGVTYQDVMVDGAGGCYWHKLTSTAASVGAPGRDFTDTAAADTLVQAVFNNNIHASKKIYGVQAAAVAFPIAEEHLALATREVAEAKNQCALACLISEGTASTNTTKTTAANFKAQVLAERKAMVKAKANPTIVLCSPDFFATMLEFAGEKYTPTSNEMLLAAAAGGQVGNFMGFTWIEVNGFASSADLAYYPHGGTKASVTAANLAKVEFIMYDPSAFGVGDNFSIVRMVDSELFAGTKAQVEENAAMRVLDAAQVHVKSYASA